MRFKICISLIITFLSTTVFSSRIKDLATIRGIRDNQLVGYGLVVGLSGTGDKTNQAPFTQQSFKNMLKQFDIKMPGNLNLDLKNVAAVAVSTNLPAFAKTGQKIDVTVSSIGNSSSLRGGELLMTPLKGADNQIYAIAQGSVVVSGFGAEGSDGSKVSVNIASSGRIPNGATVENTIEMPFIENGIINFELNQPDFTAANQIARSINSHYKFKIASPIDANTVSVSLLPLLSKSHHYKIVPTKQEADNDDQMRELPVSRYIPYIAAIENINVAPINPRAKIIVNSRTGTIVIDDNVIILPVAVSHGSLTVVVTETPVISQPSALSNGSTVSRSQSDVTINQAPNKAFVLKTGTSLKSLVDEINRIGASPGDIIAILEAIKSAGALQADLEVI